MISIITITYNAERWLERTMRSVLAQTCKEYEYIIVDGASKDGLWYWQSHYKWDALQSL